MTLKVISVSGPPGSGKSTLAQKLAQTFDCGMVGYDDFETMTAWPPPAVLAWLDDGAPMREIHAPGLRDAILKHDGLVIYETPFGRACPIAGDLITYAIWLECPDDVALARKLGALAQAGRGDRGFADWLSGWLSAYEVLTQRAIKMQRERVRTCADFRLDALGSEIEVAKTATTAVKNALVTN